MGPRDTMVEVDPRRLMPLVAEECLYLGDRFRNRRDERIARARIVDGGLQDVTQPHAAVVGQQPQPSTKGARHAGGQQPGARNVVKAEGSKVAGGGGLRSRALAAYHLDRPPARVPQDDRQVTTRTVEVGLDHLEDEPGCDRRIERISASLEDRHGRL